MCIRDSVTTALDEYGKSFRAIRAEIVEPPVSSASSLHGFLSLVATFARRKGQRMRKVRSY